MLDLGITKQLVREFFIKRHISKENIDHEWIDHDQISIQADFILEVYDIHVHMDVTVFKTHEVSYVILFDKILEETEENLRLLHDFNKESGYLIATIGKGNYFMLRYADMYLDREEQIVKNIEFMIRLTTRQSAQNHILNLLKNSSFIS